MKLRKLSALTLAVLMLAGCGSTATQTPATQAPATQASATQAPATQAPATQIPTVATQAPVVAVSGVKSGGTVIVGQSAEPITLNPNGKPDDNLQYIAQNVFSRLLKTNNNQAVILDLATGYSVNEVGDEFTFTLPKNATFHDGAPLTSADVKFSFDEIIKQGGNASTSLASIKEITCPDDYTVVFKLNGVDSGFLGVLAYNGTYILPKHLYEGKDWLGTDSMQDPVGSGPFKWGEWAKGVKITLVRNDNFYLGKEYPYLDKVVFSYISDANVAVQSFYNGELDLLGVIAPSSETERFLTDPAITTQKIIYPSRFYVGFNFEHELNQDLNFRLAVAHAMDADDMITKALKNIGLKAEYYMSPLYDWAVNKDDSARVPAHDLELAKSYMEKTGLKPDANGVYLKVEIDTYNYEPFPDLAQVLKEQLSKIGIEVTINMLEYAAWDEKVNINKDYNITLTGGYMGPEASALGLRVVTGGFLNFLNYSNPEIDRLFEEGAKLPTFELRAPKYKEAEQILADEVPMVLISEWLGYIPYLSHIEGHPAAPDAVEKTAFAEFTYMWINK